MRLDRPETLRRVTDVKMGEDMRSIMEGWVEDDVRTTALNLFSVESKEGKKFI
jgi:hypothetical protein